MNGFWYEGLICLLVTVIVLLIAGGYMMRLRAKKENQTQQLKIEMLENNYQALLDLYEKKSVLVHDVKNHMWAMAKLLEDGHEKETLAYIAQMTGGIRQSGNVVCTNHKMLDSVLNMKFQKAREEQIEIQCVYDDMRNLKLTLADICSLFTNLLDNAIEATRMCPVGVERKIDVACRKRGKMLVVSVSNPVWAQDGQETDTLLRTTKEDRDMHGFGMVSMKKVIGSHDGYMKVNIQDRIFYVVIYLVGFQK